MRRSGVIGVPKALAPVFGVGLWVGAGTGTGTAEASTNPVEGGLMFDI